jgi:predicted DNA-binding protein
MATDTQRPVTEFKTVAVRLPIQLEKQVAALSARDSNPVSSTLRRLISIGLRSEQEAEERRG